MRTRRTADRAREAAHAALAAIPAQAASDPARWRSVAALHLAPRAPFGCRGPASARVPPLSNTALPADHLDLHVHIVPRSVGVWADFLVRLLHQRRQFGLGYALVL